jgi:hypothetical protein
MRVAFAVSTDRKPRKGATPVPGPTMIIGTRVVLRNDLAYWLRKIAFNIVG